MAFPRPGGGEGERESERPPCGTGNEADAEHPEPCAELWDPQSGGPDSRRGDVRDKGRGPCSEISRVSGAPPRKSDGSRFEASRVWGGFLPRHLWNGRFQPCDFVAEHPGRRAPCCVSVAPRAEARVSGAQGQAGEPGGGESRRAECALSVLVSPAGVRRWRRGRRRGLRREATRALSQTATVALSGPVLLAAPSGQQCESPALPSSGHVQHRAALHHETERVPPARPKSSKSELELESAGTSSCREAKGFSVSPNEKCKRRKKRRLFGIQANVAFTRLPFFLRSWAPESQTGSEA